MCGPSVFAMPISTGGILKEIFYYTVAHDKIFWVLSYEQDRMAFSCSSQSIGMPIASHETGQFKVPYLLGVGYI